MSPAEQTTYDQQVSEPIDLIKLRRAYRKKLNQAYDFAGKQENDATWNGLFLMGLAMNGLDLIPFSSDIAPQPYWHQAPEPRGECKDWDLSWVVEIDAFTRKDSP